MSEFFYGVDLSNGKDFSVIAVRQDSQVKFIAYIVRSRSKHGPRFKIEPKKARKLTFPLSLH